MSIKRSYISSPALTFAILCIGLGCIVTATLKQNLAIAGLVAALPALLCILILHFRKPERFLFLLFIFNYFFTPLARYSRQDGLSILSDIIWWSVLLIVIVQTALHYRFPWKQAVNILTIGGAVLAVYCLMEVVNPTASLEAWIYSRGFIYNTFLVSLITVLLATSYKQISRLIFLFSILTLIAILKGLCQKFIGFDAVEYNAMMESGMYKTHLLPQITRYFSIFTDAGNYGSNMGFTCALFGIAGLFCKKSSLKVYYFSISALSLYSMFITGTRGAIVVPLGSLLLFALISKNIKLMSAAAVGGICIIVEVACSTYPLWEQIALPLAVKRLGADLLHCTSNTAPLCCPVPLVLTLHDIIYLEPRQQRSPSLYQEMGRHYRRLTVPRILKKCRKIITVSHFERNRIREALNIPADRITTIYNGYSRHFRPMDDIDMQIVNRYIPQKDFLFFLGNTDPKKNTARVLKAYSLYLEKSSVRRPLLIADLNETYIDRLLQQENISNRLKRHLFYPGYIHNADLATLYNAAFAFLYPSLRESFGIPLVEAMACGTPVIMGNTSSMPEVGGPDILAADPCRPEEIAGAVLRLENEDALYRQQREYGLLRARQFSWKKTADELIQVYQSLDI